MKPSDPSRLAFLEEERSRWLTVEEAAHVLSTSRDVIFRMVNNGSLPHRREGKVIRIHLDDLRPAKEDRHAFTEPVSTPVVYHAPSLPRL